MMKLSLRRQNNFFLDERRWGVESLTFSCCRNGNCLDRWTCAPAVAQCPRVTHQRHGRSYPVDRRQVRRHFHYLLIPAPDLLSLGQASPNQTCLSS